MRESLKRSLEHTPAGQGWERYPEGSIVLCNACALPIFRLDRAISLGNRMGQAASAFKPLTLSDLSLLAEREDIDPGVSARVRAMAEPERRAHVARLREVRAGDPALCPCCGRGFLQVVSVERHEVLDRAYTVEMLTVPPLGSGRMSPVRGKRIGVRGDWIH